MLTRQHAEWLVALFFSVVIAVVFYEIATSMTEQGIASGGPYDNAAAYPRAVAIVIGIFIVLVLTLWTARLPMRAMQWPSGICAARHCCF